MASAGAVAAPAVAHGDRHGHDRGTLRVATYNASLNRAAAGELEADLSTPDDPQAATIAEVLQQRTRPDVVLLNEFDYVPDERAVDLFRENYLEVPQGGAEPIEYRHAYVAPSNTGVPSGFDLNDDGTVGGGDDAFGFGAFEGQYGMVVLSRYPIDTRGVRTFQHFLWKDMPGALLPDDPRRPRPRTGSRPRSSRSCACRASRTGTSRSGWAARRSTCSRRTPRPRRSTAPRTATADATTTRSGSGRTT